MHVENPARASRHLRVAFERAEGAPADTPAGGITLEYPPARAATASRARRPTAPRDVGAASRAHDGRVLSHADFEVTEQRTEGRAPASTRSGGGAAPDGQNPTRRITNRGSERMIAMIGAHAIGA